MLDLSFSQSPEWNIKTVSQSAYNLDESSGYQNLECPGQDDKRCTRDEPFNRVIKEGEKKEKKIETPSFGSINYF